MSLNFDGHKRKVRLGGRSRTAESREEVLRRTHAEREKRARYRLEHKSALCIQAAWRRATSVSRNQQALRELWTSKYGAEGENLDKIKDRREADTALRDLLHFLTPQNSSDAILLEAFNRYLAKAVEASGLEAIFQQTAEQHEKDVQLLRISKLLAACFQCLQIHSDLLLDGPKHDAPPKARAACRALLGAVLALTDPGLWRQSGAAGSQQLRRLFELLAVRRVSQKLAKMLLNTAAASESAFEESQATTARGGVASTSSPATTSVQPKKNIYGIASATVAVFVGRWVDSLELSLHDRPQAFIFASLLCVPFLWTRCTGLKASAARLWIRVMQELGQSDWMSHLPLDLPNGRTGSVTALLGNLAEAASFAELERELAGQQETILDAVMTFTGVVPQLLQQLPIGVIFPTSAPNADLEDTEMPDASVGGDVAIAWDESAVAPDRAATQIKALVSLSAVRSLMRVLLPPLEAVPQRRNADVSSRCRAFCRLLSAPLGLSGLQNETRLALAVNPELVPRLWHGYLKEGFQSKRWNTLDDESSEQAWLMPLLIVSHCFSTFLSTSAEATFYEEQRPLQLSELHSPDSGGLLALLKETLWQALWVQQTRGRAAVSPALQHLRDATCSALSRLLGQLFDRNCRRQFAPTEAFFAPNLSEDLFTAEVQNSLSKGAFLAAKQTRVWQVLRQAPFLVAFPLRAAVFQNVVSTDKQWSQTRPWAFQRPEPIAIRRNQIFWDSFDQLNGMGAGLKERLQISFVDVHGMVEAGVDGGGLFKDLMENLVKEGFDPQLGLFLATSNNRLYPNPNANLAMGQAISAFEFLGRMIGKALYEGIIVELPLAPFFLKQLLQKGVDVNDLPTLDPEHYRNLMFLRSYEGEVEDLCLTFTITRDIYGDIQERELIPGGRNIPVTSANRAEYILRTANYRLNVETRPYTDAFRRGLLEVIEPEWVSMFNEEELQMLIRGRGAAGIDIEDLQQNVHYTGGYSEDHPTIKAFWQALSSFTPQQQAAWLKFVTACSRAPLLGFGHLSPQLCIAKAGQENDPASQERLPTSATCMNLLKLPPMKSPEQIAAKLLYAIENVSGFDLS